MSRFLPGFFVALLLAACSGGSGGGGGLSAKQARALGCVRVTTIDLMRLIDRIEAVLLTATGEAQDGVALIPGTDPGDPPYTFDYDAEFDADNDGTDDTRITGKITFPQNPGIGIPGGMDLPLSYDIAPLGATGPLGGTGSVTLNFEAGNQATLTGTGTITNAATGCDASIGFDTATGVRVVFPRTIATSAQLTAEIFGLNVFGQLGLDLTTEEDERFVGTLDLSAAFQNVTVDGTLDGSRFSHTFSIYPDSDGVEALTDCIEALVPVYADMTAIFLALSEVVDAAGGVLANVPATPGWTLDVTSNPDVANFALDLTSFGVLLDSGRIDGQVRISRVGFRLAVLWSWRLNGRIGTEIVVGQSSVFFRVQYDNAGNVTSVGAGSLGRNACDGAFEIPDDDPIQQPYTGGSIIFGGQSGAHIIEADFAVGLGGGISRRVRIDEIPAPIRIAIRFAGDG